VDTSDLFIARTGIRGTNDLVWVGRAANYAAKLCTLRNGNYVSYITSDVFNQMLDEAKYSSEGKAFWEERAWRTYDITIYRSSWWKSP
jgi:class 3 adenylate cyclase